MKQSLIAGIAALGLVASRCGSSESKQQAEQAAQTAQQAASTAQQGAQTAQQAAQQMMQGLTGMAQSTQNPQTKLIDYTVLKEMIPDLTGWEKSGVKGEQQTSVGISVSNAEAQYTKGDASMKLEITDTNFSQMYLAPFMMFMSAGFEQKSDDGYKKGMSLAGSPGFESWEKDGQNGEVTLVVGNRFLVNAKGSNLPSTEPAKQLVQAVDLAKLAKLK